MGRCGWLERAARGFGVPAPAPWVGQFGALEDRRGGRASWSGKPSSSPRRAVAGAERCWGSGHGQGTRDWSNGRSSLFPARGQNGFSRGAMGGSDLHWRAGRQVCSQPPVGHAGPLCLGSRRSAWRKAKRMRLGFLRGSRSRAASCRPTSEALRIPGVGASLGTYPRPFPTFRKDAARPGCPRAVLLREARMTASVAPLAHCSGEVERSAWSSSVRVVGGFGQAPRPGAEVMPDGPQTPGSVDSGHPQPD